MKAIIEFFRTLRTLWGLAQRVSRLETLVTPATLSEFEARLDCLDAATDWTEDEYSRRLDDVEEQLSTMAEYEEDEVDRKIDDAISGLVSEDDLPDLDEFLTEDSHMISVMESDIRDLDKAAGDLQDDVAALKTKVATEGEANLQLCDRFDGLETSVERLTEEVRLVARGYTELRDRDDSFRRQILALQKEVATLFIEDDRAAHLLHELGCALEDLKGCTCGEAYSRREPGTAKCFYCTHGTLPEPNPQGDWYVWPCGGGGVLLRFELPDGGYLLLSDETGMDLPREGEPCILGQYGADGEPVNEPKCLMYSNPVMYRRPAEVDDGDLPF